MRYDDQDFVIKASLSMRDKDTLCIPDKDKIYIYPVRVYDKNHKLKKTISVKKITARPVPGGLYAS